MSLMEEFEKRYAPLLEQVEKIRSELDVLTSDTSFKLELRRLEAGIKVIDGEITHYTSEGKFEQAEKEEGKKRELQGRIDSLTAERSQKIDGLEKRIFFILNEKKTVADEVLRDGFASIQKEAWSRLEETIDSIDSAWKEIEKFQRETGATAAGVGVHNLKIYPNSNRRELWEKVSRWVHVPV
jgi:hypothetical protein